MNNERDLMPETLLKNNATVESIYKNYKFIKKTKGKNYATSVLKKVLRHLFDTQELDLIHNLLLANRQNKIMDENLSEMLHLAIILSKNIKYNIEHAPYSPTEQISKAHESVILHSKDPKASIKYLMTCGSEKISEHLSLIMPHNLDEALEALESEYSLAKKDGVHKNIYNIIKNGILQKKGTENIKENN